MSLKTSKTINYQGYVTVEDKPVVNLYYTLGEDGLSSYNEQVQDRILYDANKEAVKKDIADFRTKIEGA
ncbi:MAG: hypothetical protein LKF36_05465 [Lactobacillus sp.]|jgi:hypothetical protein|nr:hypothetical protein [Lactobacillus sp.]